MFSGFRDRRPRSQNTAAIMETPATTPMTIPAMAPPDKFPEPELGVIDGDGPLVCRLAVWLGRVVVADVDVDVDVADTVVVEEGPKSSSAFTSKDEIC